MNEQNREPMTDEQLSSILKRWKVSAPPDLERRVLDTRAHFTASQQRRSWWRFLFKGYIRVPVPVACGLAVLMIFVLWRSTTSAVACLGASQGAPAISAAAGMPPPQAARPAVVCPTDSQC